MNLLQQRIEELGSVILNFTGNKVHIVGFYNSARLIDFLNGISCWQSKGLYEVQEIDCSRIQDNSLIIIMRDNKEVERYQYKPFFRGVVKYNNPENKTTSRTFTLRKCLYTKLYNIIYIDDNNEKQSIVCNDLQSVESFFGKIFPNYKLFRLDNTLINDGFDHVRKHDIE